MKVFVHVRDTVLVGGEDHRKWRVVKMTRQRKSYIHTQCTHTHRIRVATVKDDTEEDGGAGAGADVLMMMTMEKENDDDSAKDSKANKNATRDGGRAGCVDQPRNDDRGEEVVLVVMLIGQCVQ